MSSKEKLKSRPGFPVPPNLNVSRDLVQSGIRASDTYQVPVKPNLIGIKKITGSIVLTEDKHEFYGFNSKIWTPFKTPAVGISKILAVDNNANGYDIVGLGTVQANEINTITASIQTMSVGSISLGGDFSGQNLVNVNYLSAGQITASLMITNLSDFERSVSKISTDVIDTLIDFNKIGFNWANRVGGTGNELAQCVAVNDNRQIALVGTYDSTIYFYNSGIANPVNISFANTGVTSSFLAKYTNQGYLDWIDHWDGTDNQIQSVNLTDIYPDSYVVGYYRTDLVAGLSFIGNLNIYGPNNLVPSAYYSCVTLSSIIQNYIELYLDPEGTELAGFGGWAEKIDGNDIVQIKSTAIDYSGNIFITGYYKANPLNIYLIDDVTVTLTLGNSGDYDAFVIRYWNIGPWGVPQYATRLSSPQTDIGTYIAANKSGNDILVTGYYTTSPLFIYAPGGTLLSSSLQSIGVENTFLVKYDGYLTFSWASKLTGPGTLYQSSCVDVNDAGDIVLVGNYAGTLNIYNIFDTPVITMNCSSTFGDAFIVKYNATDGNIDWATRISSSQQTINSVSINNIGEIMVTGSFTESTLYIYSVPGITIAASLPNTGAKDVYVVKYNKDGFYQTASQIVSANARNEAGKSIATNNFGDVVVTGTYTNTPTYLEIYDSTNILAATLPFDVGTDSFLVCYNNSTTFGLGNPAVDGQLKSITSSAQTVLVYPEASVNSSRKAIRLQTNQSITMLWDALEGNWIVIDNTGSLI